ncbi:MAG: hypothetical protein COA42_00455 [Alteromonadaceae bacterium]|nr:MAG: hypothetical protein COA42_00455 [Alteromonadaceae bacterium]
MSHPSFVVLHITAHKGFGGGTQIANTILQSGEVAQRVLYLEKERSRIDSANQVFYKDVFQVISNCKHLLSNYDVIVLHSHGRIAGFYSRLLRLVFLGRVKVVHTFHGIGSFNPVKRYLSCVIESILSLLTKTVTFNSESEKRAFGVFPLFCGSKVVANGVMTDKLVQHQRRTSITEIGFAATMAFPKMHRELIELVALFNSRYPERALTLVFCGDGAQRQFLDALGADLLGENYLSLGQVNDMRAFFTRIDIYFHLSLYESFGLALAEAMGCGIPSIGVKGTDLIQSGENGWLVGADDIEGQVKLILQLLESPDKAALIGLEGRKTVLAKYSSQQMTNNYIRLYREITQSD